MSLSEGDIGLAAAILGAPLPRELRDRFDTMRSLSSYGAVPCDNPVGSSSVEWAVVRLKDSHDASIRIVRMQLSEGEYAAMAHVARMCACTAEGLRSYVSTIAAYGASSLPRDERLAWVKEVVPDHYQRVLDAYAAQRVAPSRAKRLLVWAREAVELAANDRRVRAGDSTAREFTRSDAGRRRSAFELSVACSAGCYVFPFALRTLARKLGLSEEGGLATLHIPPPELFSSLSVDFLASGSTSNARRT